MVSYLISGSFFFGFVFLFVFFFGLVAQLILKGAPGPPSRDFLVLFFFLLPFFFLFFSSRLFLF